MTNSRRVSVWACLAGAVIASADACALDFVGPMPSDAVQEQAANRTSPRESQSLGPGPARDRQASPGVSSGPGSMVQSAAKTAAALAGVLALAVASTWGMKRLARMRGGLSAALGAGGRSPSGVLFVLGRYPAGPGQQFVLLKVERRILLLSQTQGRLRGGAGGFQTLCEITDPDEVASILMQTQDEREHSMQRRFSSLLHEADRVAEAAEVGGRRVEQTTSGDALELWDDDLPPMQEDVLRRRLDRYRQVEAMGASGYSEGAGARGRPLRGEREEAPW
ncbi:MAG: flagellar biosynthetic protein FliO [Phycisphaeraceae bacterium]|nr:flagellar biosynthetic protein FliO [Phycisphaeraceae bacterium]MCW5754085.1 flagellar biosynthetic protein FliO [Phycisphaeraceae bacterium]